MLKLYSGPGCSNCIQARNYLRDKGFEFEEINIREDNSARMNIMAAGISTLPVFEVNGEFTNDLDVAIEKSMEEC